MSTRYRKLSLSGLNLELVIDHEDLRSEQRIEASGSNLETLLVNMDVSYHTDGSQPYFETVFNYAHITNTIRQQDWGNWDKPLEKLSDTILEWVLESADLQKISLDEVIVRIDRPKLSGIQIAVESIWRR